MNFTFGFNRYEVTRKVHHLQSKKQEERNRALNSKNFSVLRVYLLLPHRAIEIKSFNEEYI